MEKELYIFSNDAEAPVREFKEGIESDYVRLSTHLNAEVSAAPSYTGTPETNNVVEEIDRFKRDLIHDYKFVHVYKLDRREFEWEQEVAYYVLSHKEFNKKGERKRA